MDALVSSIAQLACRQPATINPSVPRPLARRLLWLPDRARNMGVHIMAGKGAGKSRLMGRIIAWLDFLRGIPLVIFDPHGPAIDNFLDKIIYLPRKYQEKLWPRVTYVDMSGRGGWVVPFPLYYRLGDESLYEISQRYLDIIRKVDPWLVTASIQGWNALWRIGTYTGIVLAALGYQITEAENLIRKPKAWSRRLTTAIQIHPEVRPAVEFFTQQVAQWRGNTWANRTDSFLNKVAIFSLDPTMKAMFGAGHPGVDWGRVVEEGRAVLLDFRGEHDLERRRFKMLWAFHYLLDFIKHRGAGRHRPISLIIDELSALLSFQSFDLNVFAADLDELINVIARNYMVWLTIAHQELFQLDERTQKTLMAMGTQVFGSTADMDAALSLARQFFPIDPYKVKRYEPIYISFMGVADVIDYRPVEFTIEEQHYLSSYHIKDQGRFHFLIRPALFEGGVTGPVRSVTIEGFDRDIYINERLVAKAREILSKRCGTPIDEILSEIQSRLQLKKGTGNAILSGGQKIIDHEEPEPVLREKAKATSG